MKIDVLLAVYLGKAPEKLWYSWYDPIIENYGDMALAMLSKVNQVWLKFAHCPFSFSSNSGGDQKSSAISLGN